MKLRPWNSTYLVLILSGCLPSTPDTRSAPSFSAKAEPSTKSLQRETPTPIVVTQNSSEESLERGGDAEPLPVFAALSDISVLASQVSLFFSAVVKCFPEDPDSHEVQARFKMLMGDIPKASESWHQALSLDASYGYAFAGLGAIASKEANYKQAVLLYEKARVLMPNDAQVVQGLGQSHLKNSNIKSAIEGYEEFLKQHPNDSAVWQSLGQAKLLARDFEGAKFAFETAVGIQPSSYLARQGISTCFVRLGRSEEAKELFDDQRNSRVRTNRPTEVVQAVERQEFARLLTLAAHVFIKHRKIQEASQTLDFGRSCSPTDDDTHRLLVKILVDTKQIEPAILAAEQWFKNGNNKKGAGLTLSRIYLRERRWELAEKTLDEIKANFPKDPVAFALLAEMHVGLGQSPSKMFINAKMAVDLRGHSSDYATYAQSLSINGKREEAIANLQRAIDLDPESKAYREVLVHLQDSQRKSPVQP